MKKILAIQQNFEIKHYDSLENAKRNNPIAVLEQTPGSPYTSNSGNVYQTTYYKVLDEFKDYFQISGWKIFGSELASWGFMAFDTGFSNHQFQYRAFFSSTQTVSKEDGIKNYFQIADCKGEVKTVIVGSLPELIHNLKQYINFNTWEEVMLHIENQRLKIMLAKLQNQKEE